MPLVLVQVPYSVVVLLIEVLVNSPKHLVILGEAKNLCLPLLLVLASGRSGSA
jgi:hypothetical protein